MGIKTFFMEPLNPAQYDFYLRRYSSGEVRCTATGGNYHSARSPVLFHGTVDSHSWISFGKYDLDEPRFNGRPSTDAAKVPTDDPNWPKSCGCGYVFTDKDHRQLFCEELYRRHDNGQITTIADAPVGAIYFAWWMESVQSWRGHDGHTVMVRLPGKHDWSPEMRARNCGSPCKHCGKPYRDHGEITRYKPGGHDYEDARPHKCWIRHGTPPGQIHVDKNGVTCDAGAGSIALPNWHGFLHHGELTE